MASPRQDKSSDRRTIVASLGALSSAVAGSICCLPLLPILAAAGIAGSSALLATLRPYLLATSVLLIGFGFYQAVRARKCNRHPSRLTTALLWFSAGIVVIMILFPQAIADLLAG